MIGDKMEVPLYRHNLHGRDLDALAEEFKRILSGMILTTGEVGAEVESMFAGYLGVKHCALTSSWTAGCIAALMTMEIGHGDEVIVPAMTFAATASAVEAVGAKPVIVDIDASTKLMDFDAVAAAITSNTKAVMPVHLYGQMVDIAALRKVVGPDIRIIEDAAHAIESRLHGHRPGAFSDCAVFSFYQGKTMATGEGGAFVTNDSALMDRYRIVYRHGVDISGYNRHKVKHYVPHDVVHLGIKANMPDLLALLLKPQILDADATRLRRQAVADRYHAAFAGMQLEFPKVADGCEHAWWVYPIGIGSDNRDAVLTELTARGIRTQNHFTPLHEVSYYKHKYGYKDSNFPISHVWGSSAISLPIFPTLTTQEQDYVITQFKDIISLLP